MAAPKIHQPSINSFATTKMHGATPCPGRGVTEAPKPELCKGRRTKTLSVDQNPGISIGF